MKQELTQADLERYTKWLSQRSKDTDYGYDDEALDLDGPGDEDEEGEDEDDEFDEEAADSDEEEANPDVE
jgi:hypothetical protein